jgi:hypothetical protein
MRNEVDPQVQARLAEMAAELRGLIYGEAACPVWGTKFADIEKQDMAIGRELARLLMEQSVQEQAETMPQEALEVPDQVVQPAGTGKRPLQTEAGVVEWEEPLGYLKQARRSFSPSVEGAGDRGR